MTNVCEIHLAAPKREGLKPLSATNDPVAQLATCG
jgi:hypothetical protein